MPTGTFNICCLRDCVSRHNGGTSGAPLKPLRDDSALRALSSLRGQRDSVSRTANVGTVGMNGLILYTYIYSIWIPRNIYIYIHWICTYIYFDSHIYIHNMYSIGFLEIYIYIFDSYMNIYLDSYIYVCILDSYIYIFEFVYI